MVVRIVKTRKRKRLSRPSPEVARKIREMDRVCRYCLSATAETIDHIIPRSRGGTNKQSNLVGCCHSCNHKKDSMTPKEADMVLHIPLRMFTC